MLRIETINQKAEVFGWRLIPKEYSETDNQIGLASFGIAAMNGAFASDQEAVQFVVDQAWDGCPIHISALDFLKSEAPETYVRAIYLAHGATL